MVRSVILFTITTDAPLLNNLPVEPSLIAFEELGIRPRTLEQLRERQIFVPTPVQSRAIPTIIEGHDLVAIAQTGTGKTLAFGLPLIDRALAAEPGQAKAFSQTLVLAPTRELALQIAQSLGVIGHPQGLRLVALVGGAPLPKQIQLLKTRPDIIVATPGRLEDLIIRRALNLKAVKCVVLDEADRMLDMGFEPVVRKILEWLPEEHQTLLFSATIPTVIEKLAGDFLRDPVRVEIAPEDIATDLVSQELVVLEHASKHEMLENVLAAHEGTGIIFARTRHGARKLARAVRAMGHTADEIHADRTTAQRRTALEGFKHGKFRFLIATDVASRGIDIDSIGIVVNFDLPDQAEDYVHRIGRTGRAGRLGRSVTFATPQQVRELNAIEKFIKKEIPLSEVSPLMPKRPKAPLPEAPSPAERFKKPARNPIERTPRQGATPPKRFESRPIDRAPQAPRPQNRTWQEPEAREPRPQRPFSHEPRSQGPNSEEPRSQGPRQQGADNGNNRNEGNRFDGPRPQSRRYESEGHRSEGYRSEGYRSDGPRQDRGPSDERPRGPRSDRPQYDQPQQNRPPYDRPQYDRPQYGRPQYGRSQDGGPQNDRQQFDRSQNDRPQFDQRQGDRPRREGPGGNRFDKPQRPYSKGPRNQEPRAWDRQPNDQDRKFDRPRKFDKPLGRGPKREEPSQPQSNGPKPGPGKPKPSKSKTFGRFTPKKFRPKPAKKSGKPRP